MLWKGSRHTITVAWTRGVLVVLEKRFWLWALLKAVLRRTPKFLGLSIWKDVVIDLGWGVCGRMPESWDQNLVSDMLS